MLVSVSGYENSSKCQQYNNSSSFSKDMPTEAWGLLHVPKLWIAIPSLPCPPYSSPPKTSSCIQSTCLQEILVLKFLKRLFHLHTQISALTFTLGVQELPPPKIPDLYSTASISFPLSEKMVCVSVCRRNGALWEAF